MNPNMRDLLTETSPYYISESEGKSEILYDREFKNLERNGLTLPKISE